MMTEQKGRSGKKPKYQIADIGGTDLTSQDISTERVLNFLIKGELLGSADDQTTGAVRHGLVATDTSSEQAPTDKSIEAAPPLPSPETQGKKSLAHLFRRPSVGGSGTFKGLKIELGAKELAGDTPFKHEVANPEQSHSVLSSSEAKTEIGGVNQPLLMVAANEITSIISAPQAITPQSDVLPQPVESPIVTAIDPINPPSIESIELAQLKTLWKSFYRLNDGETDALSVLYQKSHGVGSSECYIKMHKLAEMSNLTYRYCQKVTRSLEQLGWITKLKDYDASTQMGVLYRVNLKPVL